MKSLPLGMIVLLAALIAPCQATDSSTHSATQEDPAEQGSGDLERRYGQFQEMMSGVKLVGRFTVLGREEGALKEEEYTITSVKKLPRGDYWLINARIKYGSHDLTLPLPLEVKWAADTPVITLSELTIPGLGTFSSRVVLYNKKYAGTWTHGKVGGHLFGTIEKLNSEDAGSESR